MINEKDIGEQLLSELKTSARKIQEHCNGMNNCISPHQGCNCIFVETSFPEYECSIARMFGMLPCDWEV